MNIVITHKHSSPRDYRTISNTTITTTTNNNNNAFIWYQYPVTCSMALM